MYIIGLDLSGTSNAKDTACAVFTTTADCLTQQKIHIGMTDPAIVALVTELAADAPVALGIDAPLSYNPGGGDRPSDRQLRKMINKEGGKATAVMPPTLNRMVYLTLRGISLARMLDSHAQIVEVHPGAAMALRGARPEAVRQFKRDMAARQELLSWLEEQNLRGLTPVEEPTDHRVAACAAALATWDWLNKKTPWLYSAEPPFHPYDFAC